jgi:murein DD-endopeptidase MepM/ murein hydrolase activator NlpD
MMNTILAACALSLMLVGASCLESSDTTLNAIEFSEEYITDGFDFPVGRPDGNGYYNAQVFGKNNHLGDDWNGNGGGNSDLGDSVFATANGYVNFAEDVEGGWGNVIRILHKLPDGTKVETLYAHFERIVVKPGDWVKRGDFIGTVGTANGIYYAHLHFEIRSDISMGIGAGYSSNQSGYLDPTEFIREHRP